MVSILIILFVALSAADCWTTIRALQDPGNEEASPIPRHLFNRFGTIPTMIVLKALGLAFFVYAALLDVSGIVSMFRWVVIAVMIGGSAYVVRSNLRL